jgi:hypothetical protein
VAPRSSRRRAAGVRQAHAAHAAIDAALKTGTQRMRTSGSE